MVELWKMRQVADCCILHSLPYFLVYEKGEERYNVDYRYGTFTINQQYMSREWLIVLDGLERKPHRMIAMSQDDGVVKLYALYDSRTNELPQQLVRIMP